MWRLCHNSLALRVNLKRQGIKLNPCCVLCGRCLDEDGAHLFFKCKDAKRVWEDMQLHGVRDRLAQAITAVLKLKEEVQRRVITFMYIWWSEQCRVHEGDAQRSPEQIVQIYCNSQLLLRRMGFSEEYLGSTYLHYN